MQLPTLRPLRALALFLFLFGGFGYLGGGSFLVEGRGPFYNLPNLAATSNLSIPSLTPYSTLLLFHNLLTSKRFHELILLYIPKIGLPSNRPLTEIDTLGLLAASQSSQSSGVVGLQDLQDSGQIVQQVTRDKRVWSPGGRHLHDLTCDG
jgi:hypothetical protein